MSSAFRETHFRTVGPTNCYMSNCSFLNQLVCNRTTTADSFIHDLTAVSVVGALWDDARFVSSRTVICRPASCSYYRYRLKMAPCTQTPARGRIICYGIFAVLSSANDAKHWTFRCNFRRINLGDTSVNLSYHFLYIYFSNVRRMPMIQPHALRTSENECSKFVKTSAIP